jgi:hypothetical protein
LHFIARKFVLSQFCIPLLFCSKHMKTFFSALLAALLLLVSPHAASAAQAQAFHGKVTAVNAKAHTITLTEKKTGKSQTFTVQHASITVNKQHHKHLADVKVGMKAKVKHGKKGHLEIVAKTHSAKKKKKTAA